MNPSSWWPTCVNPPPAPQTPGPAGAPGPTIGTTAAYGIGTAYTLTASAALLNLGTTPPQVTLAQAGTFLLFARMRFDGVAASLTTQTLTTYLYDLSQSSPVPNTTRVFDFTPQTAVSGTLAEVLVPIVAYVATAGATIQVWGGLSGLPSGGSIKCVEADIIAVQIAFA